MLGRFSPEALRAFAEAHNLDTGNQDFSEGVFDFKVCQKPNGDTYGIPDDVKCGPPSKEVKQSQRTDVDRANEHMRKGNQLDEAGQYGKAIEEYKKALDLVPGDGNIYSNIAHTLSRLSTQSGDKRYLLKSCGVMRKAAQAGSESAQESLNGNWWPPCRQHGDNLFVDSDGQIKVRGSTGGSGRRSSGGSAGMTNNASPFW